MGRKKQKGGGLGRAIERAAHARGLIAVWSGRPDDAMNLFDQGGRLVLTFRYDRRMAYRPGRSPERVEGWRQALALVTIRTAAAPPSPPASVPAAPDDSAHTFILNFDGGCWPNPGGRATYGWRLLRADSGELVVDGRGESEFRPRTNNTAEWCALVMGLESLSEAPAGLGVGRLVIRGDSQLVLRMLTGQFKSRKPHLTRPRDRALQILRMLGVPWEAEWVPREQNQEADALTRRA